MPLNDWLTQFFSSRSLPAADGRPLYRYRITDSEFESARKILHDSAQQAIGNRNWSAVFVLYAAEWWRCHYDGHHWSWEKIFNSLNINRQNLSVTQRNTLVETGLRYWQREVRKLSGSHRYFGTIAIEGGLPLNQLRQNNNWLSRVFKQVIPKYARLQHTGTDVMELVSECEYIPKTFHNAQIHAVLGDMIATVVELKKKHQLQQRENPVAYLNQNDRDWREAFPLPINDDVGRKLLSDMIATAAKADDTLTLPIRSIRQCDNGSVQLRLELAGFIALDALGLEAEKVPGKLEVDLVSNDGKSRQLGVALNTKYKDKPSLKMPRSPAGITGDAALQGYNIRFKHLSEILKEIPLIGGERLDNDVPWVFTQRDDAWILEGLASVSTRAKQVKILYPDHFRVDAEEYQAIATQLPNKKGISGTGRIRLTDDDGNTFIIKTAQEHSSIYYYLEGKTLRFETTPSESYIGLPSLRRLENETGISKSIYPSKLFARAINSKSDWQLLSKSLQGVYDIRLCEQQAILFRKKCVLLPDDFAVRFKPSDNPLHGTIFLDCVGNAEVICETPIRHKISRENTGYRIELFAEQIPPSHVSLTFRWQGMLEMATLNLPFPARGGQIIDANGNKQSPKQPLFQDQLYGIRLRLFNEQPDHKRHLQIELSLHDTELGNTKDVFFRHELTEKGAVIEVAIIDYLEWIKELLVISRQLDSYIQLNVYEEGKELLRTAIRRYSFALERNLLKGSVELNGKDHARLSDEALKSIQLMAMRLSKPEEQHIELEPRISEQAMTGSWLFHPEKQVAEPWLIYPSEKSTMPLRPILWAVDYEPGSDYHLSTEVSTLHSAVKIGQIRARHDSIKMIFARMSGDFRHSGWEYLRDLWQHCPHLPLSSFDVWAIAVTDTQMLAALVLQMDEAFIEKLNAELPVFWELVPLRDWQGVYQSYKNYLLQQAMEEADVNQILIKRMDKMTVASQSLEVIAKLLRQSLCGEMDRELNAMKAILSESYIAELIKDERKSLDRRQADRDWPTAMKQEVASEWQRLAISLQLGLKLDILPESHRAAVALPILLAAFCVKADTQAVWLGNVASIFALKRLKSFDDEWFNVAFKWALAYYLSQS